ncbi:MAG: NAD(P)H-dependent oxidoreductase, partial [Clostridium sp.]|nr:NAD(P)H-dependent oxidoreductase [Clostridium sp.]
MKKVILLSGSPNAEGNTVQILRECAKTIEKNEVEAEVVSLAGINLKDSMNFQGGYNDGFDEIIEKIKNAKGLIVGAP